MNQQVAWAIGGQVGPKPILGILALTGEVFLDTNILLYAALGMDDSPDKWMISRQILLEGKFATSGQVLSEFYSNAIRKGRSPISKSEALNWVRQLALKPCQAIDSQLNHIRLPRQQQQQLGKRRAVAGKASGRRRHRVQ